MTVIVHIVYYVCVQFEKIEAVNDEESFVLLTDVHSLTSCPMKILSSRLLPVRTLNYLLYCHPCDS